MPTRETKILTFRAPNTQPEIGGIDALDVNLYKAEILAAIGEGWEPVSHTLTIEETGALFGSILIQRVTEAPDHP